MNRQQVKNTFKEYTDAYNSRDEKIRLKIEHTAYVAKLSDIIAESLGLSDRDQNLAWLIGMLHDIGRFEQIRRYQTFNDAISVDHAKFGADLLFCEGLIEQFMGDLTREELDIVELAIRQHNKYRVVEGLSDREMMFCNIIRDADKIDILRVNVQSPMEVIYGVTTEELLHSDVTPEVLQCFEEEHCVLKALRKTAVDNLVGHISLAFELVYPESRRLAAEQGYLNQMLDFHSQNPKTNEIFAEMKKKMGAWIHN